MTIYPPPPGPRMRIPRNHQDDGWHFLGSRVGSLQTFTFHCGWGVDPSYTHWPQDKKQYCLYGCWTKNRGGKHPQIMNFNRVFEGFPWNKPSILGYPIFGNTHMGIIIFEPEIRMNKACLKSWWNSQIWKSKSSLFVILLMEEILRHLGCINHCQKYPKMIYFSNQLVHDFFHSKFPTRFQCHSMSIRTL